MKYVLFLRGVNVGGKNRVAMAQLRQYLQELGFWGVSSYINSGNLLFEMEQSRAEAEQSIRQMLARQYPFEIPFALNDEAAYRQAMESLPEWWYGALARRDVLFFTGDVSRGEAVQCVRGLKLHSEIVHDTDIALFWGKTDESEYLRTAYHKALIRQPLYAKVTIRSGSTAQKLYELLKS